MTVPPQATAVPGDPHFGAREAAFNDWRSNVILGTTDNHTEDVAHEAFCSGWEAAAPHLAAAERAKLQPAIDRVAALAEAAQAKAVEGAVAAERERLRTASNPESLGVIVREVWVSWAQEQPDPKPAWLTEWDDLDDGQREVDMRIGVILAGIGAAAEREWCAQLAEEFGAWVPGKSLGPGRAEPGRFFAALLREAQP